MIAPASATQYGGILLTGAFAGSTADNPQIAPGYITDSMLAVAHATVAELNAETARAEAAEAAITTGYEQAVSAEITARASAVSAEATARASAITGLQSQIAALTSSVTDGTTTLSSDVSTLTTNLNTEVANRESGDTTNANNIIAVANNLATETSRAEAAEGTKLTKTANLSDLQDVFTARTNLGLGTAATADSTAFDTAGAATAVQTNLTAETTRAEAAENTKLAKSANLSDIASAATARTNLGLGSAATEASTAFDAAGTAAAEQTRAEGVEATLAVNNTVVHLSGTETVTGNKNFTGTLTHNSNAVVDTTDSRLSDARDPLAGSVGPTAIVSGGLPGTSLQAAAGILSTQLSTACQTALGLAASSVQTVNGHPGPNITLNSGDVGAVAAETLTTTGDLLVAAGPSDLVRLGVGADNTLLQADHTQQYGVKWSNLVRGPLVEPAYSASITPNAEAGVWQTINVSNNTAFTINAPSNPPASGTTQELVIEIYNTSGGPMGTITWASAFVFSTGSWFNPATGNHRFAKFAWNGGNWICTSLATSDY